MSDLQYQPGPTFDDAGRPSPPTPLPPISLDTAHLLMKESLYDFTTREKGMLSDNVSERCCCGRLSMYLQAAADRHAIWAFSDTEYNRNRGRIKKYIDDQYHELIINCDLILHRRGLTIKNDNLIAVEMKKSTRPEEKKEADRSRLRALTMPEYEGTVGQYTIPPPKHVCGYLLGVFVVIHRKRRALALEFYENGKITGETEIRF